MEHLFAAWRDFAAACREAPHVLLLSDYDGTLTPIVGRPKDAVLSGAVRDKLPALAHQPRFSVGIISGRAMNELKALVAISGIYYAGNHGLEIEGPGLNWVSPEAETARATINDLSGQLAAGLQNIAGAMVEDKGLSISVHYRLVKKGEEGVVAETFKRLTAPLVAGGEIKVTTGKKIWEVRPPIDWHKGRAVTSISREIRSARKLVRVLTVCLGDDATDEDAFRVVRRPDGWSVYVGPGETSSAAEYFLRSPAEVEEFLARLIDLK